MKTLYSRWHGQHWHVTFSSSSVVTPSKYSKDFGSDAPKGLSLLYCQVPPKCQLPGGSHSKRQCSLCVRDRGLASLLLQLQGLWGCGLTYFSVTDKLPTPPLGHQEPQTSQGPSTVQSRHHERCPLRDRKTNLPQVSIKVLSLQSMGLVGNVCF